MRSNLVNNYAAEIILDNSSATYPDNPFDDLNLIPYGYDRRQNNKPVGDENTNDTWVFVQGSIGESSSASSSGGGTIYHQRKDGTVVKWSYTSNNGVIAEKEFDKTSAFKQKQDKEKIERGEPIEGQKIRDIQVN